MLHVGTFSFLRQSDLAHVVEPLPVWVGSGHPHLLGMLLDLQIGVFSTPPCQMTD